MKKRINTKCILLTTIFAFAINFCGCAGCNKNDVLVGATPTASVEATSTPNIEPTETVEPTNEVTPTDVPGAPETPTPQPSPVSTATPEPTPVITVGMEPEYRFQMGDNVWYEYYENSTVLVITGTGSTWDFDDYKVTQNGLLDGKKERSRKQLLSKNPNAVSEVWATAADAEGPLKIVVEEGITRLGREALAAMGKAKYISLPGSLVEVGECAFMNTGATDAEWVGLDFKRINIANNAFLYCYNENIEEMLQFRATPTAAPLPTATPIPNPDKPRLVESKKMGDNVTFEFYDNGYLYVKGTGATWDKSFYFDDFDGDFYQTIENVVIEEGVTYIGNFSLNWMSGISYWKLPKSLKSVGNTCGGGNGPIAFHGYMDEVPITVTTTNCACLENFFDAIADIEKAKVKGYVITFN